MEAYRRAVFAINLRLVARLASARATRAANSAVP
jgi:hypothetical protein